MLVHSAVVSGRETMDIFGILAAREKVNALLEESIFELIGCDLVSF